MNLLTDSLFWVRHCRTLTNFFHFLPETSAKCWKGNYFRIVVSYTCHFKTVNKSFNKWPWKREWPFQAQFRQDSYIFCLSSFLPPFQLYCLAFIYGLWKRSLLACFFTAGQAALFLPFKLDQAKPVTTYCSLGLSPSLSLPGSSESYSPSPWESFKGGSSLSPSLSLSLSLRL